MTRKVSAIYCTLLAVLVGFTDYITQLFTLFYCWLHELVLQSFHYSRFWIPDVLCQGGLLMSSLFEGWLQTLLPSGLTILRLFIFAGYLRLTILWVWVLCYDRCSVGQSIPHGIRDTSDSYVLDSMGRPLWREDGSVLCMCCWPLPVQPFSGPRPLGLGPYFTVSDLRLPLSSPPTTRGVTVEVFDPVSTRVWLFWLFSSTVHVLKDMCADWKQDTSLYSSPFRCSELIT
jgi:hypothetical protein